MTDPDRLLANAQAQRDAQRRPEGWPKLDSAAYHGPAGEFALATAPHTEADPIAVLVTTLVMAGCAINRGPHALAGNDRHPASLFAVIVGDTAKGGKGTSFSVANAAMTAAVPGLETRIMGGFGSGERIVDMVRDATEHTPGAPDTRLLIHEPEFARFLKVAGREGSIASMIVRDAWDGRALQVRSRGAESISTKHHLAMIGHITRQELAARLTEAEVFNGFANRFLWVLVRRSNLLPGGGNVSASVINKYATDLHRAINGTRARGLMVRTAAGEARWEEVYFDLAKDEPGGLLGAAVCRDAPQCLRLSLLYALLDGAKAIDVDHIDASFGLWSYARKSAEQIFGDALGDNRADLLLAELRRVGAAGLDGTAIRDFFGRNVAGAEIERVRRLLEDKGLAVSHTEKTGGRSRTVTTAVADDLNDLDDKRGSFSRQSRLGRQPSGRGYAP